MQAVRTSFVRKTRHTFTRRIIASTLEPAKLAPGYAYSVEMEESNEFLSTQQDKNEKTPRSRTTKNTQKLKHDCKVIERAPSDALRPKFKGSALTIECAIIEPRQTVKEKMYYLEDYGFAIWGACLHTAWTKPVSMRRTTPCGACHAGLTGRIRR